jgi:hypothetical protein
MARPRKGSSYWSGLGGAKGWCVYCANQTSAYYLRETGVGPKGNMVETVNGVRTVKRYGPFESFKAAQAAFIIMGNIEEN